MYVFWDVTLYCARSVQTFEWDVASILRIKKQTVQVMRLLLGVCTQTAVFSAILRSPCGSWFNHSYFICFYYLICFGLTRTTIIRCVYHV
jgi:hypothetical protein